MKLYILYFSTRNERGTIFDRETYFRIYCEYKYRLDTKYLARPTFTPELKQPSPPIRSAFKIIADSISVFVPI